MRSSDVNLLNGEISKEKKVRFLAPLDNLLWDRKLVKDIFGFDYKWEVYTPESKRKYGYYVLPILYGGDFIGRFEPEFYKKEKGLVVKNFWWEYGIQLNNDIKNQIKESIYDFCKYLDSDENHYEYLSDF